MLLFGASVGILGMLTIAGQPLGLVGLMVVLFGWGGIVASLSTVGPVHLGSRLPDADLAQANAAFAVMDSIRLIIDPPLVGLGMDIWSPRGFVTILTLLFAAYLAVVIARMTMRRAV